MDSHYYRIGKTEFSSPDRPTDPGGHRRIIEPWLSAILQVEHVNVLLGSGMSTAVSVMSDVPPLTMGLSPIELDDWELVLEHATRTALKSGRGAPNIEDQIRSMLALMQGLEVLADPRADLWVAALDQVLASFVAEVLRLERDFDDAVRTSEVGARALQALSSFLLTFASRAASRERLGLFTTNYDRFIEYACDRLGLRVVDRFVGVLEPQFRTSRLEVDYHYSPPGIRGEPRYLEGVLRLHKLHGSIDWAWGEGRVVRRHTTFGGALPERPGSTLIFPNPAKDVETALYPYAELFRDFSAALCRPNSVLITYGYGFGDDHVNRVIEEMLSIPSTHLVAITFEDTGARLQRFISGVLSRAQITLLVGSHFGDLHTLVTEYLPKPAIDQISWRRTDLLRRRGELPGDREALNGEEERDADTN